ncbi:MAG TPA: fused MFS/spermidine synthase [Methylomirabilota bacterium]|nr:fused MFS/spermidine synthase [Methylomirabilota bacterium]
MTAALLFFFASGACALVYQVVWVRQLLLIVGTTTAAVSTVLSVFMAGLGLGAWLFGAAADRSRAPLKLYAGLELGIGLYALGLPALITASTPAYVRVARHLAEEPALLLLVRVALGFGLLLVPAVLMGGTLPVLVRHVGRSLERLGADLGLLYGANLAGAVAGSLAAGFVLIPGVGVQGASMTAAAGNLSVGAAALLLAGRTRDAGAQIPAATAAGLLTAEESLRILRTVQDVFPETTLWLHGHTGIIVARRDAPVWMDLRRLAAAFERGALRDDLERLGLATPLDFARLHAMGPDEIRAATSAARPVTDDRPSLEFHRLRHPLQEYRGPFNLEQARMMRVIYRRPVDHTAPLLGAVPGEAEAIADWGTRERQRALADVQRYWGLGG